MLIVIVFIFGLIIGSFLNALLWRMKSGESIAHGRSHCRDCKHELGAKDLVPIFSFLVLRGRCRYCQKKISWQYPLVEAAVAILFSAVFLKYFSLSGMPRLAFINNYYLYLQLFRDWFFVVVLTVVFVYDLKYYLILDKVTLPAMAVALILNLFLGIAWWNLLLAGAIGGGFFALQFFLSRGKWIGGGDIRLGFLMGLMLGWPKILAGLFIAYIVGALVGILLIILKKKTLQSAVPFGVFLSLATIVVLLWGDMMINWYLGLLY